MLQSNSTHISEELLVERLRKHHFTKYVAKNLSSYPLSKLLPAAVLIPLKITKNGIKILLTQRTGSLSYHAGEVSFPGGKLDSSDKDEVETSLREAEEEIGLPRHSVKVVAQVVPLVAISNILVNPVIGIIPEDFCPTPNETEVEAVFELPLERFLQDSPQQWALEYYGFKMLLPVFTDTIEGRSYMTYGLTAYMCVTVAAVVYQHQIPYEFGPYMIFDLQKPFEFFEMQIKSWMKYAVESKL